MKKIFIALDTSNIKKINKIIRATQVKSKKLHTRLDLNFLSPKGRNFLAKLKNKEIFLDLKLNDIPNTCVAALKSLKDIRNISYLTVHINGGFEMIKAVKKEAKKINKRIKILGVTVLTSFSNTSIKKIGHTKSVKELVIKQAALAKSAKLDGIVCSGYEAKYVKKICKNMEIVTPGIRLSGDNKGDQKRVMTPKQAFQNGSTAIVMGRSLTGNIGKNLKKLFRELN